MNGNIAILIPVVAILATAWVIVVALTRRQHRGRRGADGATLVDVQDNVRLTRENEDLKHVIKRLEERLQVLERIATDPAARTAAEIERLR